MIYEVWICLRLEKCVFNFIGRLDSKKVNQAFKWVNWTFVYHEVILCSRSRWAWKLPSNLSNLLTIELLKPLSCVLEYGEKRKEKKRVEKKGREKKEKKKKKNNFFTCVLEREGKKKERKRNIYFFRVLKQERKERKNVIFTNLPF